jgi:hypothetical protein
MMTDHSGPLTWAQQEWFADLGSRSVGASAAANNSSAYLPGHRLPVAVAMTAINDLVERHEGLRTLIAQQADGQLMQAACTNAGVSDVVRTAADGPEATAAFAAATATAFRLEKQWPVLFVLVTDGDAVTRIGIVVDHVAIDAWGWKVLGADLDTALIERSHGRAPFMSAPPVEQPLESARWETGPAGERHARRAGQFWRNQFETLRDGLGDWTPTSGAEPADPVLCSYRLASAATATSADALTAATGVRASALYLLAFATAVAEVEGCAVVGVHALSANRLSTGVQKSVRKAVMPAPVVVGGDARGTFADRLSATANQQLDGFRFANFEPGAVAALNDEILGELQGSGAVAARFNFLDNSIIPSHLNHTSLGGENIPFTDPSIQGTVTADPPRPGGSRYILSVQHQAHGALMTLACHQDTAWSAAAADMLWHVEDLMVWAAAGYPGATPRFGRGR